MFRKLIKSIKKAVKLNHESVDSGNIECSSFTAGMVKGYADVLWSMGHHVWHDVQDNNGCKQITYLEIDSVVLVAKSKIDLDGFAKLQKE